MTQNSHVVVVGAGVAGSAIAFELSRRGHRVSLLYRAAQEGSSFTNQKWNHSGLLYPAQSLAHKACREFMRDSLLRQFTCPAQSCGRFLALDRQTLDEREELWTAWNVHGWGLDWRHLEEQEYCTIGTLGDTRAVGGFAVPDCIVDFPRLVGHLRGEITKNGADVVPDANVTRIRIKDKRVTAVEFFRGQERLTIECSLCVLAIGAWSNTILESSGITAPDLILRKCAVFEYDNELVPAITTCLDTWRHDRTKQDVTLVPFHGKTLAAGTGFTKVVTGDDNEPDPREVERLYYQLVQCFPGLGAREPRVHTCIKTEKWPGGKPNVGPQIYGSSFHGVTGLTVAIPGKASFMFDLAETVGREVGVIDVQQPVATDETFAED